jgi:hypothetical protein
VADVFQKISYGSQIEQQLFISSQQNHINMNEQNFDYLKKPVEIHRFRRRLTKGPRPKDAGAKSQNSAIAHKTQFGSDQVESLLQFKKSEQNDMYFFNRYYPADKKRKGGREFPTVLPGRERE